MTLRSFPDPDEEVRFRSFHQPRHYLPRDGAADKARAVDAGTVVRSGFSHGGGAVLTQKIVAIRGPAGRGLSWAAAEVLAELDRVEPPWKEVVALDRHNAAAAMLGIAGCGEVRGVLRSCGVAAPGGGASRAVALLLLAGSAGAFCASAMGGGTARSLALLAVAALGLAGWWALSRMAWAGAVGRLAGMLDDPGLAGDAAKAAGAVLGRRLPRVQGFLVFVVDDYSRLSGTARAAVIAALGERDLDHAATWFVFDSDEPGLFRQDLAGLRAREGEGPASTNYELQPFSPQERVRIAGANGLDGRSLGSDAELFASLREARSGRPPGS